ncbi:MAG: ATP-grasp domain-containing protein [Candidatus Omnitrophica bacterium]|nr:ATP-grasp domain-containing protein [Candidatus Omnitrophota bacterium]
MYHIKNSGIHSVYSACSLPPHSISDHLIKQVKDHTCKIAQALKVIGLLNIQYAIKDDEIYVLEVNPRASRTAPYVSKATGNPLAKIAAQVMTGRKLAEYNLSNDHIEKIKHFAVKECVLPFSKFSGVDVVLGPEMKSTGEVMGIADDFGEAFAKSQIAAGASLPKKGKVLISVRDEDKSAVVRIAKKLDAMKFSIVATLGTASLLKKEKIEVEQIQLTPDGKTDLNQILEMIKNDQIDLLINTPSGERSQSHMALMRASANLHNVPIITTLQGADAAVKGIEFMQNKEFKVKSLQEYFQMKNKVKSQDQKVCS